LFWVYCLLFFVLGLSVRFIDLRIMFLVFSFRFIVLTVSCGFSFGFIVLDFVFKVYIVEFITLGLLFSLYCFGFIVIGLLFWVNGS